LGFELSIIQGAEHHHGALVAALAQLLQAFHAAHARHQHIEKNQLCLADIQLSQQLFSTAVAAVLLVEVGELGSQQILDAGIVINDGHQGCTHHNNARP